MEYIVEYTEDMVYVIAAVRVGTSTSTETFYEERFNCSAEHPIEVADKIAAYIEETITGASVEVVDATE